MPRYFFHVHDGTVMRDRDGTELPDLQTARAEALMLAGKIIGDAGARRDLGEEWVIEVTDETGLILFRMDFVVAESAATGRTAKVR